MACLGVIEEESKSGVCRLCVDGMAAADWMLCYLGVGSWTFQILHMNMNLEASNFS